MFILNINTDNAAFEGDASYEIVRILSDVADSVQSGYTSGICRDINGNKVGTWEVSE